MKQKQEMSKLSRRVVSNKAADIPQDFKRQESFDGEYKILQRIWQYKLKQLPDDYRQNEDF